MIRSASPVAGHDIAQHYDELDGFYRDLWGEHLHHGLWRTGREPVEEAVKQLVRDVARNARIEDGCNVCDVGAGYGATARMLAAEYGARVTAFTLSPVQHAHACEAAAAMTDVRHVLGDWLLHEPAAGSCDAVIAIESTEHMEDKAGFFAQSARVLAPGGHLVVCAWLADPDAGTWARRTLLEPICSEGRLPSMGTAADYEGWIREAGLTLRAYEDLTRRVRRTWVISCRRMMGRMLAQPSAWAWLLDRSHVNRVFALTVVRILAAYYAGVMRYGMFTAVRT